MKLPIQAQPVMRTLGMKVGVDANNAISPSGPCGTGRWCCNVGGKSKCYNCTSTLPFVGSCLQDQVTLCGIYGGKPSSECHL